MIQYRIDNQGNLTMAVSGALPDDLQQLIFDKTKSDCAKPFDNNSAKQMINRVTNICNMYALGVRH